MEHGRFQYPDGLTARLAVVTGRELGDLPYKHSLQHCIVGCTTICAPSPTGSRIKELCDYLLHDSNLSLRFDCILNLPNHYVCVANP